MRRSSFRHLLAVATLVGTSAPLFVVSANSAHAQDAQLDEVEITGEGFKDASTEYSGAYTSNRVTIGRGERSLRDIPQSVGVITREQMNDQASQSIDDALGTMAGVTVNQFNTNAKSYSIRGFRVSTMLLDGSPYRADVGYTDTGAFDTAIFDRIEVLRGPSGMLQGAGEPSGTINLVRKRASTTPGASVAAAAGSWDTYRGEVDATGPLDDSGRLRGRFVAVYEDRGSFIDYVENEKTVIYGTLEYDITPDTTFSVGLMQQNGNGTPNLGLPARDDGKLLDLDRETFLGSKWDNKDELFQRYFAELEHRFANGGSFHIKANTMERYTDIKQSSAGNSQPSVGNNVIDMFPWRSKHTLRDSSLDVYTSQPVNWFGREHRVLVGASHQIGKTQLDWGGGTSGTIPQDIFNPDPNTPEPAFSISHLPTTTTTQTGLYAQGDFSVADRTTLVLGGRFNWWESRNNRDASGDFEIDNEFTPYVGLLYDITEELTAYTSYTTIFQPQSDQDINFRPLEPRTGDQIEVGLKGEYFEGDLNWEAALFQINDKDRAVDVTGVTPTPDQNPWPMANAGKARSEGVELSVSGRPLDRLDITAGYAYIDTEFLNGAQDGLRLSPDTPEHNFALWARYRFSDNRLQGWRIGAGVNAQSSIYSQDGAIKTEEGGVALLSAMVGYRLNAHFDVTLKGNNLTDKEYYSAVSAWSRQNHYGDPRNYMLTMRYTY